MSELILHPEYEKLIQDMLSLQNELSALLAERDNLIFQVCKNIEAEYIVKIGVLEYKVFEENVKLIRLKRKIELIQQKLNRCEKIEIDKIEQVLDEEYKEYTKKVNQQAQAINDAVHRRQLGSLSDSDADDIKRLYRQVVKKLHPDLHPHLTPFQKKLFISATDAYKNGDLDGLRAVCLLIEDFSDKDLSFNSIEELKFQKEKLEQQIKLLSEEIDNIKSSFPYNQLELLKDPNKIQQKCDEFNAMLDNIKSMYDYLKQKENQLLEGLNG